MTSANFADFGFMSFLFLSSKAMMYYASYSETSCKFSFFSDPTNNPISGTHLMLNKRKDGIKPKKNGCLSVTKDKTIVRLKIVKKKLKIWRKSIIPFQISTAAWSDQKTVSKDIVHVSMLSAWVIARGGGYFRHFLVGMGR